MLPRFVFGSVVSFLLVFGSTASAQDEAAPTDPPQDSPDVESAASSDQIDQPVAAEPTEAEEPHPAPEMPHQATSSETRAVPAAAQREQETPSTRVVETRQPTTQRVELERPPSDDAEPETPTTHPRGVVTLDMAFYTTSGETSDGFLPPTSTRVSAISPLISGYYKVTPRLRLDAAIGLAGYRVSAGGPSSVGVARFSNTLLGARFVHEDGAVEVAVGGQLALPTASLDDNAATASSNAYDYAAAMRGGRDYWLWSTNYFSIVVPTDLTFRKKKFTLHAQLALAFMFGTGDRDNHEVLAQFYVEGSYRVAKPLIIGGGLSTVSWLTSDGIFEPIGLHTALNAFLRFPIAGDRVLLHSELWTNDSFRVWGLRFGGSVQF